MVRAKYLLSNQLEEQFDLIHLAANVGVSPTMLGRTFKEQYGCTPMTYRRRCRLDKAIELIRHTHPMISQA